VARRGTPISAQCTLLPHEQAEATGSSASAAWQVKRQVKPEGRRTKANAGPLLPCTLCALQDRHAPSGPKGSV
jgi:hypothetical protein